jgi:hypothetical protein
MKMTCGPFGLSRFEVHPEWHIIILDPAYASPAEVSQIAPELEPQLARELVLQDRFYSHRVASQKTPHSLHSRGAKETCQSSLRLLTWR